VITRQYNSSPAVYAPPSSRLFPIARYNFPHFHRVFLVFLYPCIFAGLTDARIPTALPWVVPSGWNSLCRLSLPLFDTQPLPPPRVIV